MMEQHPTSQSQRNQSNKLQPISSKKMITFALLLTVPAMMTGCSSYSKSNIPVNTNSSNNGFIGTNSSNYNDGSTYYEEEEDDDSSGGRVGGYYGGTSSKKSSKSSYTKSNSSSYKGFGSSGSVSSGG